MYGDYGQFPRGQNPEELARSTTVDLDWAVHRLYLDLGRHQTHWP